MDGALTHGIIVLEMETLGSSPTLAPAGPEDGQLSTEREGASAKTGTGAVATHEAKPTTELGKTGKRPTTSSAREPRSGSQAPAAWAPRPLARILCPLVSAAGGARKNAVSRGNTLKGNALCSCPSQQGDVAEETVVVWVARPSPPRRHRLLPRPPHGQHRRGRGRRWPRAGVRPSAPGPSRKSDREGERQAGREVVQEVTGQRPGTRPPRGRSGAPGAGFFYTALGSRHVKPRRPRPRGRF